MNIIGYGLLTLTVLLLIAGILLLFLTDGLMITVYLLFGLSILSIVAFAYHQYYTNSQQRIFVVRY